MNNMFNLYLHADYLNHTQFCLHRDGTLHINSSAHLKNNEGTARDIRKEIKEIGGTVGPKTWWSERRTVVKLKRDACRYTQELELQHNTARITITIFVDLN